MFTATETVEPPSLPFRSSKFLLKQLERLHPRVIDLSLGRVKRLLAALGHPELRLPPVVHVAGTNGKGSQIAFLRTIAEAHGKRVHAYTSPHLVRFHERIALAGPDGARPIEEDYLVDCLARARAANKGELITLFEITTVAAFLAFSETPADLLLLETGLGGRLDATNVVARPALTMITPISIDHVEFLGDTVAAIAGEKAGILKSRVPCISSRQPEAALDVVAAQARKLRAPMTVFGHDFAARGENGRLLFTDAEGELDLPSPSLIGEHQIENAGAAIAAARKLFGAALTQAEIERGLLDARWPARLERLPHGALHGIIEADCELWLDGGHNVAGGQAVARVLADFRRDGPIHLVWGMIDSKDAAAVIAPFKGVVDHVFTVRIPQAPGSYSAAALAEIANAAGLKATATYGVAHALLRSQATKPRSSRIVICGSLYLAGHVLELHS